LLKQSITQCQVFSQTMAQNLSFLQMNHVALNILISNISNRNPLINLKNYYTPWKKNHTTDPAIINEILHQEKKIYDNLREELILELEEHDYQLLYLIIGNLNNQGFLPFSSEKICQGTNFDPIRVEYLRDKIIHSSYKGLSILDSKEYLLFMANDLWGILSIEYSLAKMLITSKRSTTTKKLTKLLDKSETMIIEGLNNLKKIPISPLGENSKLIYPDIIVTINNNILNIRTTNFSTPYLDIKDISLGENYTKKELKFFLKEAQDLEYTLKFRNQGILKHAEALILARSDFFFQNEVSIPNIIGLKNIAKLTGRHISTVSRALKDRYFIFEGHIYPFSVLLVHKVGNSNNQQIKQMIQKIINLEDKNTPLSDKVITEILNKKGIKIARRTVHKYRTQMNIDPLYKR